jgi:hypothetical protein
LSATGTIKATGDGAVVNRWLPMIRAHKESIIAVLKVGTGETAEPFDKEAFEERAAICEFDGGLSRDDAEAIAWIPAPMSNAYNRPEADSGRFSTKQPFIDATRIANGRNAGQNESGRHD